MHHMSWAGTASASAPGQLSRCLFPRERMFCVCTCSVSATHRSSVAPGLFPNHPHALSSVSVHRQFPSHVAVVLTDFQTGLRCCVAGPSGLARGVPAEQGAPPVPPADKALNPQTYSTLLPGRCRKPVLSKAGTELPSSSRKSQGNENQTSVSVSGPEHAGPG